MITFFETDVCDFEACHQHLVSSLQDFEASGCLHCRESAP